MASAKTKPTKSKTTKKPAAATKAKSKPKTKKAAADKAEG